MSHSSSSAFVGVEASHIIGKFRVSTSEGGYMYCMYELYELHKLSA